jgi:Domain of unknown function (DUF4291)
MLPTELYNIQTQRWPQRGQHILAHFDITSVVVYQAYRPSIGHYAVQHQTFGGEFSFTRMTWIKTNFLWMMYRSGWGTKPDQEVTLAIRIQRTGFDQLLQEAVHSSFDPGLYADQDAWKAAVARSSIRLQWDPDHDPHGAKLERRAIQLGLRDEALAQYVHTWIIEIEDISDFVAEQRSVLQANADFSQLRTPSEAVYPHQDAQEIDQHSSTTD